MLSKTHSKYIQSLHLKKFRDAEGVFLAEGNKVVPELLLSGQFKCRELLAQKDWLEENSGWLKQHAVFTTELEPHEMEKITALSTASPVMAIFEKKNPLPVDVKNKISLLLDTIQDPGNLGTIIRIADWFGVSHILCTTGCADMYNPKVVQSTMGSLARVNIVYKDVQQWLNETGTVPLLAAALDGKPVQTMRGIKEAIIVIGNESKGISKELFDAAGERITISRRGEAESLNAAVATGIILSHLV